MTGVHSSDFPSRGVWSHRGRHRLPATRPLEVMSVGLELAELARPLVWTDLFGQERPVEMEIGVGKGTFLLAQAKARPDVHFVGIEWSGAYWSFACDRLRRQSCLNVRVVRAEALFFLTHFVRDGSVAAVHALFPDPWPKKRHRKRRLFQEPFLRQLERVLAPGGRLQVVTDHEDYFRQVLELIRGSQLQLSSFLPPPTAAEGELVGTNFERKYRREGRALFALAAVR